MAFGGPLCRICNDLVTDWPWLDYKAEGWIVHVACLPPCPKCGESIKPNEVEGHVQVNDKTRNCCIEKDQDAAGEYRVEHRQCPPK
jgi:hypothetical protein